MYGHTFHGFSHVCTKPHIYGTESVRKTEKRRTKSETASDCSSVDDGLRLSRWNARTDNPLATHPQTHNTPPKTPHVTKLNVPHSTLMSTSRCCPTRVCVCVRCVCERERERVCTGGGSIRRQGDLTAWTSLLLDKTIARNKYQLSARVRSSSWTAYQRLRILAYINIGLNLPAAVH